MRVLFDTSVLVAGSLVQHPNHAPCFMQLQTAQSRQVQGYLSTHSLAETYSVLTRLPIQPRLSPSHAESIILDLLKYLEPVSLDPSDYRVAIAQIATLNIQGGGIFDALIAQAAIKIKVDKILTLNPSHFTRLGIAVAQITQVPG